MAETTRVELDSGGWLDVKTATNLGDLEYIELAKLERGGKTTPLLDSIDMLDRLIVGWSFDGEVTREGIRANLSLSDLSKISTAVTKRPNSSSPSSNGGPRRAKKEASQ